MATIKDYTSGKVCDQLKLTFSILDSSKGSLRETRVGNAMLKNIQLLAPRKLTVEQAVALINEARCWAVGDRVCKSVHKDTPATQSVFLDELAEGMAAAGKARLVSRQEAVDNIRAHSKSPIIVSRVSGKPAEICPTWPKRCLYWNMEKHKLKCIQR